MSGKTETKREQRFRNFVSIGYPESLKENWQDILADSHIPAIVSPLHDRDKNPDGEAKKPHFHIMLLFTSVKTKAQAQEVFDSLGAVNCQVVNSLRGETRYFLHLDNPEKERYDIKDVKCFSGADFSEIVSLPSDRYAIIRDLIDFIERNEVMSFSQLSQWCAANREDWFRAICDNCAYIIREYIKSRAYTFEHNLSADISEWVDPSKQERREDPHE